MPSIGANPGAGSRVMTSARQSRSDPRRWRGTTRIGDGWAAYQGDAGDSTPHAHHALQLVCGVEGPVRLWVDGVGEVDAPAAIIASKRLHRLAPGPVAIVFVDASSRVGRRLSLACPEGVRLLDDATAEALKAHWPRNDAGLDVLVGLAALLSVPEEAKRDRKPAAQRVRHLVEGMSSRERLPTSIDELAAEVALSPAHFRRHLTAAVGLPFGSYVRWLRLRRALALAAGGATLTQAAHDSGFADASHLTRTMHEHFGVAPSDVLEALRARR